jgi:hypothetical protein
MRTRMTAAVLARMSDHGRGGMTWVIDFAAM